MTKQSAMPTQKSKEEPRNVHNEQGQKQRREDILNAINWLCDTFPQGFNLQQPKPLKTNIQRDLFAHLSGEATPTKTKIRNALSFYTHRTTYLKAVLEHTHRIDLQGEVVEEIAKEQKAHAQEVLANRPKRKFFHIVKNQKVKETNTEDS